MAALDYAGLTIDRLWAILEDDTGWSGLVRPGNRIKRTGGISSPRPRAYPPKSNSNVSEYPQCDIRLAGGSGNAFAQGANRTFGQQQSNVCPFILGSQRQVVIVYTIDELRYDTADLLVALAEQLILASGEKLGMPDWCNGWGPYQWRRTEKNSQIEDSILIPVNYRIPSSILLSNP